MYNSNKFEQESGSEGKPVEIEIIPRLPRQQFQIDRGLLPMEGRICKHSQLVNGLPTTYLSINLNYVVPTDINDIIKVLYDGMITLIRDGEKTNEVLLSKKS